MCICLCVHVYVVCASASTVRRVSQLHTCCQHPSAMTVKGHLRVCTDYVCVFTEYIVIHTVPSENIKYEPAPQTVSGPESLQMLTANYYQNGKEMVDRGREIKLERERESERAIHIMKGIQYICVCLTERDSSL